MSSVTFYEREGLSCGYLNTLVEDVLALGQQNPPKFKSFIDLHEVITCPLTTLGRATFSPNNLALHQFADVASLIFSRLLLLIVIPSRKPGI